MQRLPMFVAYGRDGMITGIYQASRCDRVNWKMVYSIARSQCEYGGRVEVSSITE